MTVPELDTLRDQARGVLGAWARGHADSRELGAALVSADGELLDHAVYAEDASGGYWTLASGADVLDAGGAVIARATLEQVLAQTGADGASTGRAPARGVPANDNDSAWREATFNFGRAA